LLPDKVNEVAARHVRANQKNSDALLL